MTQEPRREVEVQGRVGEAVPLLVGNAPDAAYTWTLELPDGVEHADEDPPAGGGRGSEERLRVRAGRPGSYVLVATLADPSTQAPMTVLPIRLTVA
jgi:hypothetical protein